MIGRPRGRVVALAVALAMVVGGCLAAQADAFVYWTNASGGTVGRANLDGSGADQMLITGASAPEEMAVDGQHVYWANGGSGTIGRANLDGSGVDQSFITGASSPFGVAVDGQHVYWTNGGSGTIGRANLDGSGVDQSFITGASSPDGGGGRRPARLLDQPLHRRDRAGEPGRLGRRSELHHRRERPGRGGGRRPARLLDQHRTHTIGRANLDGSGVDQSFITGANVPTGVAVDGQHVYWTNQLARTRSGGRTSTARASIRASSPAPTSRSGWRSMRCRWRRRRRSARRRRGGCTRSGSVWRRALAARRGRAVRGWRRVPIAMARAPRRGRSTRRRPARIATR